MIADCSEPPMLAHNGDLYRTIGMAKATYVTVDTNQLKKITTLRPPPTPYSTR